MVNHYKARTMVIYVVLIYVFINVSFVKTLEVLNVIFIAFHFGNNSEKHYLAEYRIKMTITVWLKTNMAKMSQVSSKNFAWKPFEFTWISIFFCFSVIFDVFVNGVTFDCFWCYSQHILHIDTKQIWERVGFTVSCCNAGCIIWVILYRIHAGRSVSSPPSKWTAEDEG